MTLGPPVWAEGSWAVDAWQDGTWSQGAGADFEDLSTLWTAYIVDLKTAAPTARDVPTLVAKDVPTMRSGNANLDDANTAYASYLTN